MRRSPFVLLVLPVAWVACFSSSSSSGGGGANFDSGEQDVTFPDGPSGVDATPDVGHDVGPDVTMDVAVNDAPGDSMGPPQDASADVPMGNDASEAEAAPAAVAITVFGATGPEQGITIVYGDATGAVVGAPATTGATGMVSQPLPAGATMITALLGSASSPAPYTVMGVQPGDTIVVPDSFSLALYASGSAQVTALPAPTPPNAVSYTGYAGLCSSASTTTPITVGLGGSQCIGLGMFGGSYGAALPVLVEAIDANGNLAGFTFQKNNPLSGFDAGTWSVSLAADTWSTATTTQDVVVANQPDGSFVNANISESADAVLHGLAPQFVTDDAGVQHTLVTTHVGYADTLQAEATMMPTPQGGLATAVAAAPPTASATLTIDATPLGSLPTIASLSTDTTTPARPTLTWTLAQGSLATTTGIVVNAAWSQLDEAGALTASGVWTIVAPSSATSIQAPALPASASAYAPPSGATFVSAIQGLVGSSFPSYAQLRTVGAAAAARLQSGCMTNPVLPFISTGTMSITVYTSAVCG